MLEFFFPLLFLLFVDLLLLLIQLVSFTIQIDDGAPFLFGEDTTFNVWHWVRYPVSRMAKPVVLSKGRHTIIFRNREDGVALDQFLLTTEKRFVPVGIASP